MHKKMCARTRSALRWWIGRTFRSMVLSERKARSTLAHTDRVLPIELTRVHAGLDLLEVALGGRQQLLTLVRAQPGQRFIAAGHQALTGVVRRAQLEQIALIQQVPLKMPPA